MKIEYTEEKNKSIMEALLTTALDVEEMMAVGYALANRVPKEAIFEGEMTGKYICPACGYNKLLYAEWNCKHCGQRLR